ncbi:MAG: TIGR00730 family Rossman fold protein [Gemmatimonadaceae bacterium]
MTDDGKVPPAVSAIGVFCGSTAGTRTEYAQSARQFGQLLAKEGISVVFGGGKVGLMGEVANGALEAGGRVVGVIPRGLVEREIAHDGLTELHVVETMHERKARMAELSGAFVALPGGLGTLDELFEIWTWFQLGLHHKPIGILNIRGFFDPLLAAVAAATREGFIRASLANSIVVSTNGSALLKALRAQ